MSAADVEIPCVVVGCSRPVDPRDPRTIGAMCTTHLEQQPSRCPRCEGYEATYHTFEGECSEQAKEKI